MQRLAILLILATTTPSEADAEQPASGIGPVAIAGNTPLVWKYSVASSGWLGWWDHHAIRANFARYRGPVAAAIGYDLFSESGSQHDFGHTTDLGVGWVYFPRRMLDGPSLEAGFLVRLHRERDRIDDN